MAIESLVERVRSRYSQLTKGQRLVADRLARQPDLLAFASGAEIGRETGVSESTVIRLAYALGYQSYVEMQQEARSALAPQRTRELLTRSVLSEQGATEAVLTRVMEHDTLLIRQTMEGLPAGSFGQAVDLMARAKHIYVSGARSSYGVAAFLAYTLRTQLGSATLLEVDHPHFLQDLTGIGPEAALVTISFPRYTGSTLRIAEYAAQQGCPVVAITDNLLSPLGRLAQVTLTAAIDSPAATDSYTATLSLATALLTAVALRRRDEVDQQLTRIEQVYAKWGVPQ